MVIPVHLPPVGIAHHLHQAVLVPLAVALHQAAQVAVQVLQAAAPVLLVLHQAVPVLLVLLVLHQAVLVLLVLHQAVPVLQAAVRLVPQALLVLHLVALVLPAAARLPQAALHPLLPAAAPGLLTLQSQPAQRQMWAYIMILYHLLMPLFPKTASL